MTRLGAIPARARGSSFEVTPPVSVRVVVQYGIELGDDGVVNL